MISFVSTWWIINEFEKHSLNASQCFSNQIYWKKKLFLIQQMILQNSSCTKRLRTEMNKREQRTQHVSKLWVSSCLVKLINSLLPGVVAIRSRWLSNSNLTNTKIPDSTCPASSVGRAWDSKSQGRGFEPHVGRHYFLFWLENLCPSTHESY